MKVVDDLRAWGLRQLDVIPGLQRLVSDLVRVELIDRSMAIAAQGLLAIVPLLVVLSAFLPSDAGAMFVERFSSASGVDPAAVPDQLTGDQVRSEYGAVGLVITLLSATSFARAVQRMYERVWERRHIGGVRGLRISLLWLLGWLLSVVVVGLLGVALGEGPVGSTLRLVVQVLMSTLLWWWAAHLLLMGRERWLHLLPGALLTGAGLAAYAIASSVVMPPYVASSVRELGSLGLVLAVATWLIGFAFVMLVASVAGRVLVEDDRLQTLWEPLVAWWSGRRAVTTPTVEAD